MVTRDRLPAPAELVAHLDRGRARLESESTASAEQRHPVVAKYLGEAARADRPSPRFLFGPPRRGACILRVLAERLRTSMSEEAVRRRP